MQEPEIARKTLKEISFLQAEDFYNETYAKMYRCLKKSIAERNTNDLNVLIEYCLQENINTLTTVEIVTKLTTENVLVVSANIIEKAKIIRRKAIMRQILSLEKQIFTLQQELDADTNLEIIERVDELRNKIQNLQEELNLLTGNTIFTESLDGEDDNVSFVCRGLIPRNNLSILVGENGIGKTYTAIHLSYMYVQETGGKVALWLSEDSNIRTRLRNILQFYPKLDEQTVSEKIKFTRELPVLFFLDKRKNLLNRHAITTFELTLSNFDMLIVDPLISFYGGDENDNAQMRIFLSALQEISMRKEKIIIAVHHTNKAHLGTEKGRTDDAVNFKTITTLKEAIRGATAVSDTARNIIFIRPSKIDKKKRQLVVIKSNYGATGKVAYIEMPFSPFEDEEENNTKTEIKKIIPYR